MRTHSILTLLPFFLLFSCKGKEEGNFTNISGFAQGTTYSITFESVPPERVSFIRNGIETILRDIDSSMSVYQENSVISRINRNEINRADRHLEEVFILSRLMSEKSGGAFDITVGPLVKAWGFGPDGPSEVDDNVIDSLKKLVGYRKVNLVDGVVYKDNPGIKLDVNAIAQGYTVDLVYQFMEISGIRNFLVEIGGEVRVKGSKGDRPWKIGIDRPFDGNENPGEDLQAIIELTDRSLATSGNYRKFYIKDGIKYSHTIDPATGYPAMNNLLSATILTKDCSTADALATSCMVMGLEKAKQFVLGLPGVDAYFIYSGSDGSYEVWMTEGLKNSVKE